MRMAILGPPGSDPRSLAELLAGRLDVPVITMRDLFRYEARVGSARAAAAARYMNAGRPVPFDILLMMISDRVTESDAARGYVLDNLPFGYLKPSALDEALHERGAALDRVVSLRLSDSEALRRLSGRRMCHGCGDLWHVEFTPTLKAGTCDHCGGETCQREADSPESVMIGLISYRPGEARAIDHYNRLGILRSVDATLPASHLLNEALA